MKRRFACLVSPLLFVALAGCHAPLWEDADVVFEGEFDAQDAKVVRHAYRFELPEGKEGWEMCQRYDLPPGTLHGFEDVGQISSPHANRDNGSCGSSYAKLDPGPYVFFIESSGKGSYRVALYFH